jgi:hypothetical protein
MSALRVVNIRQKHRRRRRNRIVYEGHGPGMNMESNFSRKHQGGVKIVGIKQHQNFSGLSNDYSSNLLAGESVLYLCDGSGRINQLGPARENCQTLFRSMEHGLDTGNDARDVRGDKGLLIERMLKYSSRKNKGIHTLMLSTVEAR